MKARRLTAEAMRDDFPQIAREAWDFRKVADSALQAAALYEYARSSNKLRNAIWKALTGRIAGREIRLHILNAIKQRQLNPMKPWPDCFPGDVWRHAHEKILAATGGNWPLCALIMEHRPDFPNPWIAAPVRYSRNPDFLRVLCTLWCRESESDFGISINWRGATIPEILASFEKWLRREAKKHPEMKGRGKPSQRPVTPLAWLAALRMHKAGYTYPKAKKFLEKESNYYGHLPKYSDKSGWSDALRRARMKLAELERTVGL